MLLKIFRVFLIFILFGYFEKEFSAGYIVAMGLGLYKYWDGDESLFLVLAGFQLILEYCELKSIAYLVFIGTDVMFVLYKPIVRLGDEVDDNDMHISFRPFEKEIRSFLFQHNPSILHRVDTLLDHYKGNEEQLYRDVIAEHTKKGQHSSTMEPGKGTPSAADGLKFGTDAPETPVPLGRYVNEYTPDASTYYRNDYQESAFNNRYHAEYIQHLGLNNGNKSPVQNQGQQMRDPGVSLMEMRRLEKVRREVETMFQLYHPSMLPKVDTLMRNYRGREHELLEYLSEEYGYELPSGLLEHSTPMAYDDILRPGMAYSDAENIRTALWGARKAVDSRLNLASSGSSS